MDIMNIIFCVIKSIQDWASGYEGFLNVMTFILIILGFFLAIKQLRSMKQANMFDLFTKIHETLNKDRSYQIRAYLHEDFTECLYDVIVELKKYNKLWNFDLTKDNEKAINPKKLKNLIIPGNNKEEQEKNRKEMLRQFREKLQSKSTSVKVENVDALQAAELTLLDFDKIAVPYCLGNRSAKKIAKAYRPVIEKTAPILLPFVEIQEKLRGKDDHYKWHYRYLLQKFNISLPKELRVPCPLCWRFYRKGKKN